MVMIEMIKEIHGFMGCGRASQDSPGSQMKGAGSAKTGSPPQENFLVKNYLGKLLDSLHPPDSLEDLKNHPFSSHHIGNHNI